MPQLLICTHLLHIITDNEHNWPHSALILFAVVEEKRQMMPVCTHKVVENPYTLALLLDGWRLLGLAMGAGQQIDGVAAMVAGREGLLEAGFGVDMLGDQNQG